MTTEEIEAKYRKFIEALRGGNRIEVAATFSGLTMYDVKAMRQLPEVDAEIRRAQVEMEMNMVSALTTKAVEGNTDAARWFLERQKTDAWLTEKDRRALKMAEDRWRIEKKVIRAELSTDPQVAVQMLTGKSAEPPIEAEVVTPPPSDDYDDDEE